MATIPEPVMAIDFGRYVSVFMLSDSKTRFPSKGMPGIRNGRDPVHSKMLSGESFL